MNTVNYADQISSRDFLENKNALKQKLIMAFGNTCKDSGELEEYINKVNEILRA
ncbi:MAG: hypothetical protein RDV48_01650 [Candidatus Eremiobacteraeota bacterium]|nr:hypothetical protein [Candidatus Eremiobacteraeota bacterium]